MPFLRIAFCAYVRGLVKNQQTGIFTQEEFICAMDDIAAAYEKRAEELKSE